MHLQTISSLNVSVLELSNENIMESQTGSARHKQSPGTELIKGISKQSQLAELNTKAATRTNRTGDWREERLFPNSSIDLTVPRHSRPYQADCNCYKISDREISWLINKKRKAADVPALHLSKFQGSIKA